MKKHRCDKCGFRAKYDANPQSLLGRLWRWHTGWCPGWKRYISSLPEQERAELMKSYDMTDGK